MGKLHHFLGIKVTIDDATERVWIGQPSHSNHLLQRFGMEKAKSVAGTVDVSIK